MDREAVFTTIGGVAGCRRLAEALYEGIGRDPLLRPLFPPGSLHCAIEEFSAFLVQHLGGPAEYTQRRWWLSLRESHGRFRIGRAERDAWLGRMEASIDRLPVEEPARSELREFFAASSKYLINAEGHVPSAAHASSLAFAFPLDDAVAAIRKGDAERALELARGFDPSVFGGLLALMMSSPKPAVARRAREEIRRNPAVIGQRYAGRTLLHEAAALGELAAVELLLELGADPNELDGGDHAPLYTVGNQCRSAGGGEVVRALVRAGARVNAAGGVQRCTALHMAARRGNVEVGRALLECGADLRAVDRSGATALVRARNCRQKAMAEFLASRM